MLSKVRYRSLYNYEVSCNNGEPLNFHFPIKVMQKISADYEELKKAFESQKCPKDDKIQALRSTGGSFLKLKIQIFSSSARALESENSLLQEEKGMIMRENKSNRASLEAKIQR